MRENTKRNAAVGAILGLIAIAPLSGCDYINLVSGKETCQKWTDHHQSDPSMRNIETEWTTAFFKAFYQNGPKGQKLTFPAANAALLASMDSYCRKHADVTIAAAATQVMLDAITPAPGPLHRS